VPRQLGRCWATQAALSELHPLLVKPSPERIKALLGPAWTQLGVEGLRSEVAQIGGEDLNTVHVAPGPLRKLNAAQAAHALGETYDRYISAVRTTLETNARRLIQHHEANVPTKVADLADNLVERGASVAELAATLRSLQRQVAHFTDRVEKENEKASQVVRARHDEFHGHLRTLRAKRRFTGGVTERAATALNGFIAGDAAVQGGRALRIVARGLIAALARAADDVLLVHREAVALSRLREEFRTLGELATAQSSTIVSVIKPAELEPALKRIDQGVRNTTEELPTLDLKALIGGGHIRAPEQVEEHVERLVEAFEDYFANHLTDVGHGQGTEARLRGAGLDQRDDAQPGLLRSRTDGRRGAASRRRTVIVASGQDLELVAQVLRRDTALARIEAVAGTDPRSIMLHRRIEGLTIEAIPTFPDARRAAGQFPHPEPGLNAWETLASSGHLVGAYDQESLTPDRWERGRATTHRRQSIGLAPSSDDVVTAGSNGDGHAP